MNTKMLRLSKGLATASLAVALSACGASRQAGWDREVTRAEGDAVAVLEAAEAAWAERGDVESLRKAITLYEKAEAIEPGVRLDTSIRLARAYYLMADGHHRGDSASQLKYYDLAVVWGERAMAHSEAFRKEVEAGKPVEDAISVLGKEYAGAVYWAASGLGKWAKMKGFTTLLAQKNKVKKFMEYVSNVDPGYYYSGPARYWGAYYAIAPSFAGGDPERSKAEFEKSLAEQPLFLGTKVLMADTWAPKVQDKEAYRRLLQEVIDGDAEALADVIPEQKIEQEKARELIALIDDRFAAAPSDVRVASR
jgi:hypothetical protein